MSKWITEAEAAKLIGVDRQTLARWQRTGRPAPFPYRIGGGRRYKPEDVKQWIASRRSVPRETLDSKGGDS